MLLQKLYMYPPDDFYEDEEGGIIEGMEPVENDDGETSLPPFIDI